MDVLFGGAYSTSVLISPRKLDSTTISFSNPRRGATMWFSALRPVMPEARPPNALRGFLILRRTQRIRSKSRMGLASIAAR